MANIEKNVNVSVGGSTSSDNPIPVNVSTYNTVTDGETYAYRIGHLIYIVAGPLTIKTPSVIQEPVIRILGIEKIRGFEFLDSSTVFAEYDYDHGQYTGYGLVLGMVLDFNDGRYEIAIPITSADKTYTNVFFSMVIPLRDEGEHVGM